MDAGCRVEQCTRVPWKLKHCKFVLAPNFTCIVVAYLVYPISRPIPIKQLSSQMDKCLLLCLHTTVTRWGGLEVRVLALMPMEDTTGTTNSAEIAMLIA